MLFFWKNEWGESVKGVVNERERPKEQVDLLMLNEWNDGMKGYKVVSQKYLYVKFKFKKK